MENGYCVVHGLYRFKFRNPDSSEKAIGVVLGGDVGLDRR